MTTTDILGLLNNVRRSGAGWTALCPGHPDKKASLSIAEGDDGRVLLKCFSGCTIEQICAALNIQTSDLFSGSNNGNARSASKPKPDPIPFAGTEQDIDRMRVGLAKSPECQRFIEGRGISLRVASDLRWGFVSATDPINTLRRPALSIAHYHHDGKLAGIKFRALGEKLFAQIKGSATDGLFGAWLLNRSAEDVLLAEGFFDTALALSYGFNAVGMNSASAKLNRENLDILRGFQRIYLIGDQDIAGQRAIDQIQERLPADQVIRVRVRGWKDIGELWFSDRAQFPQNLNRILRFARASRTRFEFEDLLSETEIHAAGNVERFAVEALVPLNAITMVFAEEKSGKSLLWTYMLKCAANGIPVFGKYPTRKMPAIVLDLESSPDDIEGYLSHFARLGPEKIRYFTRQTGCPPLDSEALLRLCERERPLLLLESLTKFVSASAQADMFHPGDVSKFFDKVLNLCAAGATVGITHHATRADGERYADSHQIGASVARAFAVVSEDRPRLNRVRLEGQLFRGAEPVTEHLIAFPVIAETGHFGLAAPSDPDVERVVAFVQSKGRANREEIKSGLGIKRTRAVAAINRALKNDLLTEDSDHFLAVPNVGNGVYENSRSQDSGTAGTDEPENEEKLF